MIEKIVVGDFLTNSYIITNQGKCIIVDPGLDFADTAAKIKETYEVVGIFLTHGHIDHIDGIRYFDVPIYIHEREVEFLKNPSLSLYAMFGKKIPFQIEHLKIIPIHDGMDIDLIGYKFHVLHTPGHTWGSVVYFYNQKLISGDTLFHLSTGRTDFPTGNALQLKNSLNKIFKTFKNDVTVYPGHDETTTIGLERRHNPFI